MDRPPSLRVLPSGSATCDGERQAGGGRERQRQAPPGRTGRDEARLACP